jgi:hypothetical protein
MSDAFQAIKALEDPSSVYALISPDSVNQTASQVQGIDFLTLLMSQIQSTMAFDSQSGEAFQVPFEMPELDESAEALLSQMTSEEQEALGLLNGTLPFMFVPGMEGELYQGSQFFDIENTEQVEQLVNAFDEGPTELGQVPTDIFESLESSFRGNGVWRLDIPTRNDSFTVENEVLPVELKDALPRFIFDSVGTSTLELNQSGGMQGVLSGLADSGMAPDIKDAERLQQLLESVIPGSRGPLAQEEMTLRDQVHLKSLEPTEMTPPEDLYFSDEDLVLNSTLGMESMVLASMTSKSTEDFKLPRDMMDLLQKEREQFKSFEEREDVNANVESTTEMDEGDMTETRQEGSQTGSFKELFGTVDVKQTEKPEFTSFIESDAETRIRQLKEAQAISNQIVKSASFKNGVNGTEFSITLEPDYLGQLRMKVSSDKNSVSAHIVTESEYTKNILLDNIQVLKDSLQDAGVRVNTIEIVTDEAKTNLDFNFHDSNHNPEAKTSSNESNTEAFELPDYKDFLSELNEKPTDTTTIERHNIQPKSSEYLINYLA